MRDKFAAGLLFGLVADIPKMLVDILLHTLGFSRFYRWHVAGGVIRLDLAIGCCSRR